MTLSEDNLSDINLQLSSEYIEKEEIEKINLNKNMLNLIQINSQENMLLKSIEKFYESVKNIKDFILIMNSECIISIRLIDYFITKYSKKYKINYKLNDSIIFNVYQSYKQQLKIFQKKNFDPFARGIRIPYFVGNMWIITTIGQLNFYKWFISKNILNYVYNNKDSIEIDMNKNKKNKIENKINKSIKIYKKFDFKIVQPLIQTNFIKTKEIKSIIVTF